MSLSKIVKQYKDRPTYFGQKVLKRMEWLLKSKKDIKSLKLTDVVKEVELKHCVRCHKDYCEDDPNDICKIEHGKLIDIKEPAENKDCGKYIMRHFRFECGCSIRVESPHDEIVDFETLEKDYRYCYIGGHTDFLYSYPMEFPKSDDLFRFIKENNKSYIHKSLNSWWGEPKFIDANEYFFTQTEDTHNGYYKFCERKLETKEDCEQLLKDFKIEWKKTFKLNECRICVENEKNENSFKYLQVPYLYDIKTLLGVIRKKDILVSKFCNKCHDNNFDNCAFPGCSECFENKVKYLIWTTSKDISDGHPYSYVEMFTDYYSFKSALELSNDDTLRIVIDDNGKLSFSEKNNWDKLPKEVSRDKIVTFQAIYDKFIKT